MKLNKVTNNCFRIALTGKTINIWSFLSSDYKSSVTYERDAAVIHITLVKPNKMHKLGGMNIMIQLKVYNQWNTFKGTSYNHCFWTLISKAQKHAGRAYKHHLLLSRKLIFTKKGLWKFYLKIVLHRANNDIIQAR